MQRYELVEGTSSKFWEVEVAGGDLTVRFGRIGTAGQSKTKTFDDASVANKERDKLIKEKTGKGYALTASSVGAAVSVAAASQSTAATIATVPRASPKVAPTAAPPAAAGSGPSLEPAPTPASAPALTAPSPSQLAAAQAIAWPSGGFQWKDEWRRQVPIVRGIHAPPIVPGKQLLANLIVLSDSKHGWEAQTLQELAVAAKRSWTYWGGSLSKQRITRENLAQPDFEYWLELLAQARCSSWEQHHLVWLAEVCVTLHGLPFAMEVSLAFWEIANSGTYGAGNADELFGYLRQSIACADEVTHNQALDCAERLRTQSAVKQVACAHLFPHIAQWATECVEQGLRDSSALLKDCVLPPAVFAKYLKSQSIYLGQLRPALYLQVQLHGEAAFDVLALVLAQSRGNKDMTLDALELVTRMHVPQLIPLLVSGIENREIRGALEKLTAQYAPAVLQSAIDYTLASRNRTVEGWTVRLALRDPAALASALAAIDEAGRARFEATLAALQREDAPNEKLPPLLREPPWLRSVRQLELPALELAPLDTQERLEWTDAEQAQARKYEVAHYQRNMKAGEKFPEKLCIKPEGAQRLLRGEPLQPGDVEPTQWSNASPDQVLVSPERARLVLWNSYPATQWGSWYTSDGAILALLAEYGVAALPGFNSYLKTYPEKGLPLAAKIDSPIVAELALHALRNSKKSRVPAAAWVRAHPRTTLFRALPQAFSGNHSAARDNARHGIRWLAANGFETLAREVAQAYGEAMVAALDALLGADPLLVLPGKMPKLPSFFVAASFRRPELHSGEALPLAAVEHVGSMLAISRLDAPYPGLDIVKEACSTTSLSEFAWDVFEAWLAAGAPSKEGWAFTALGLLGNDETARRLAPRIREWPGESAHARAVAGLDLLAAIGSDVALMHLNGIAGKVKFKALQERAKEKIAVVAEARGFTPAELADRLVPDLGLDDSGTLELDFGPRKFHIGFDETLKPFVKDAQGVRLKDLPKPIKTDDAALAEAATERFKQMKKDAKAIASLQVQRLEMGMVSRRRWPAADFRLFFIEHPLMRHLAARVVWGMYDNGTLTHSFRVAEDWTLADGNDDRYELPEGATVGISHVLEIPKETLDAFGQIFGDYELLQPFKQLSREIHTLTPDEQKQSSITRFKDKVVGTGSVLGLVKRGWERGEAQDGGWVGEFNKHVSDELQVDLELDPGTVVGDLSFEPKQKLPSLQLRKRGSYDKDGLMPFAKLDPILASEVLRDIELLAPFKE